MLFRKEYIEKIVKGEKTQTRRLISAYEVGRAYPINNTDIEIIITNRYRQRLGGMTQEEIQKEGYATLEEFKVAWIQINHFWAPDIQVWVYEFKVISQQDDNNKIRRR